MGDCTICNVFTGVRRIPNRLIYRDDVVGAWHEDSTDEKPEYYLGTLCIAPRRHVGHEDDLTAEERRTSDQLVRALTEALQAVAGVPRTLSYKAHSRRGNGHAFRLVTPYPNSEWQHTAIARDWAQETYQRGADAVIADVTRELRQQLQRQLHQQPGS